MCIYLKAAHCKLEKDSTISQRTRYEIFPETNKFLEKFAICNYDFNRKFSH